MDREETLSLLNKPDGKHLLLNEIVWLTVRFGNKLYMMMLIIAENLAGEINIGTAFQNRHVIAIKLGEQKVQLLTEVLPIIK